MLCCDSGPTGARGTDSFPGHKAVTQGHTAGPTQVAAGGPPAHRALPSLDPPAGPLSQAHITWLATAPGQSTGRAIKALAPGRHGVNPASAIHWLEPQFPHLYAFPGLLIGLSSSAQAEAALSKGSHYCCGCRTVGFQIVEPHTEAWVPLLPTHGLASRSRRNRPPGAPGFRKIYQQSSEWAPQQRVGSTRGQASISLAVACAWNSARHPVRVGFTGVRPGLSHGPSPKFPRLL